MKYSNTYKSFLANLILSDFRLLHEKQNRKIIFANVKQVDEEYSLQNLERENIFSVLMKALILSNTKGWSSLRKSNIVIYLSVYLH